MVDFMLQQFGEVILRFQGDGLSLKGRVFDGDRPRPFNPNEEIGETETIVPEFDSLGTLPDNAGIDERSRDSSFGKMAVDKSFIRSRQIQGSPESKV